MEPNENTTPTEATLDFRPGIMGLIFGSHYWIGFSKPGYIASGCINESVEWWLENIERCAEGHGYSEAEQQEYRLYVEMIVKWMDLHGLRAQELDHAEGRL